MHKNSTVHSASNLLQLSAGLLLILVGLLLLSAGLLLLSALGLEFAPTLGWLVEILEVCCLFPAEWPEE